MYHASKISKFGKLRVSRSIDSLNISPNIIKYHLEGEELNALKGSVNTIKKNFVLLINIYHNMMVTTKYLIILINLKKNADFI